MRAVQDEPFPGTRRSMSEACLPGDLRPGVDAIRGVVHRQRVRNRGLGSVRRADLPIDRPEVEFDGVHGKAEPPRNLRIRHPLRGELQDFDLTLGQLLGRRSAIVLERELIHDFMLGTDGLRAYCPMG